MVAKGKAKCFRTHVRLKFCYLYDVQNHFLKYCRVFNKHYAYFKPLDSTYSRNVNSLLKQLWKFNSLIYYIYLKETLRGNGYLSVPSVCDEIFKENKSQFILECVE